MKAACQSGNDTTVAARVAGEDIRCGDFVTVLNELVELPSYLWSCSSLSLPPEDPIRFRYIPHDTGSPMKVVGVCLPFVYVESDRGAVSTLDTRLKQIVRLDHKCARKVWKRLQAKPKRKKR
ncbi:hypothetical protein [Rosistilla oblonga]|uniref:Uncharacterized protein n=1 Tax=Rosistilla oblonga TaxID=2527990 RepID=A0A518J0L5_9BACT|nr:hypothetical protein [Rosistilla oblonga]QDV58887.1 hypothetical protein Mal33_49120 [Rosistilla oblonga]